MNIVATEDMDYLAQQPAGKLNMILAGMTALMNDIDNKAAAMGSQNWFQRMVKTVTGKNKLTVAEIQHNQDKLNAYMSEAIAGLYNMNRIDHDVMMSLGVQINELYADHIQLKQMLGAFVSKLNEKIDSVDNFHMLITEIDHGVYSQMPPIVAVCKVMSQFDNRILEDDRKLDIISRSLSSQNILNSDQIKLTDHLASILGMSMEDMGQVHLELGTIRENFMASIILDTMEGYYFLPDLARKMKDKKALIEEIVRAGQLDPSVSLSIDEIYGAFLDSKINVKNGLIPVERAGSIEQGIENGRDDVETTQLGIAAKEEGDFEQAVKYFRIAAENGYADAQNRLGVCYDHGEGVAENKTEAFKWYMKAAQQGFDCAQRNVGICYYYGEGVAENKAEAFKWYMKAAQQGFDCAQHNVGICYYYGEGVAENKTEAFKWYMKAAQQGFDCAQHNVGICYYYGEGVAENKSEAFKWFMKAAQQDDPDAQYSVGICYYYGEGVAENKSEAFKWYMKAAQQGENIAQYNVGRYYHSGISGIDQNHQKAIEWLTKSAKQGNDQAQDDLLKWYNTKVM